MAKGWETIQVHEELHKRLKKIHSQDKKRPENQKFNAYIENMLYDFANHIETVQQHGYFIQFISAEEKTVNLRDNRIHKPVSVYINNQRKELQCEFDDMTDCIHVGFCYAIPEVYKALIEHGFRPPRKGKE